MSWHSPQPGLQRSADLRPGQFYRWADDQHCDPRMNPKVREKEPDQEGVQGGGGAWDLSYGVRIFTGST